MHTHNGRSNAPVVRLSYDPKSARRTRLFYLPCIRRLHSKSENVGNGLQSCSQNSADFEKSRVNFLNQTFKLAIISRIFYETWYDYRTKFVRILMHTAQSINIQYKHCTNVLRLSQDIHYRGI